LSGLTAGQPLTKIFIDLLADLTARGVLGHQGDGSFVVDDDELLRWAADLADLHQSGFDAASLLTVTSSLRLAV
jgi:hypothetical protein